MHLNYIKGRYGYASNTDMKALLGLRPGQKLPAEGMPERLIQGVRVYVTPKGAGRKRILKSSKHRIMAICGQCYAHVSVGRLHQHKCPTLSSAERAIRELESLPIYGNHHSDSPAFEIAHTIAMGDAPLKIKLRALARMDAMTGCNEFPPTEADLAAYIKECTESEGPVKQHDWLTDRLDAGQLRERIAEDTAALVTMLATDDPHSVTLYDILNDIKSDVSVILAEADLLTKGQAK